MKDHLNRLLSQLSALPDDDLRSFLADLPNQMDSKKLNLFVGSGMGAALKKLSAEDQATAVKQALGAQTTGQQQAIVSQLSAAGIGAPSSWIRDRLWLLVISGFTVVLVGSFGVLAVGVFIGDKTKPELVLSMFTSVVGFLAGLFAPSPVADKHT